MPSPSLHQHPVPISTHMASALPSFIELMASLGLDNDAKSPSSRIISSRPRSDSSSSASSLGSSNPGSSPTTSSFDISSESTIRDVDIDRRHGSSRLRTVRYSPYASPSSSTRQSSSTSLTPSVQEVENSRRSTSPRLSSSPARNKPSPLLSAKNSRELHAPISSYARRRTPQNSPTAATFPHRVHTDLPDTIVLPSLLPAPISH